MERNGLGCLDGQRKLQAEEAKSPAGGIAGDRLRTQTRAPALPLPNA